MSVDASSQGRHYSVEDVRCWVFWLPVVVRGTPTRLCFPSNDRTKLLPMTVPEGWQGDKTQQPRYRAAKHVSKNSLPREPSCNFSISCKSYDYENLSFLCPAGRYPSSQGNNHHHQLHSHACFQRSKCPSQYSPTLMSSCSSKI